MKKIMTIEGMMCVHCEARVKKCLEAVAGEEEVDGVGPQFVVVLRVMA